MLPGMPTASPPIPQDGRELGDGLGIFLQRIARTRLLTPAEELELARRIERGDLEAKDRMIDGPAPRGHRRLTSAYLHHRIP